MKKEYDFSKGTRGKFYNENADFRMPIYLEPEIENFYLKLANKQKVSLATIVNNLLSKDKELIELVK